MINNRLRNEYEEEVLTYDDNIDYDESYEKDTFFKFYSYGTYEDLVELLNSESEEEWV